MIICNSINSFVFSEKNSIIILMYSKMLLLFAMVFVQFSLMLSKEHSSFPNL